MGAGSSHHHKKHYQRAKKNVHWRTENAEPPTPPGKPQLLPDVPNRDRDVFTIRWDEPDNDGGSPIIGYLVEHRRTGSPYWVRASPHMVQDTELMISGLEPGWRYQFRVTAENDVGFSEPGALSEPLTVTYQRSPAAAPSFIRALHDTTALENEKVEFTVQVEGIPIPKICWYKDGFEIFSSRRQRIVNDNDISTLIIHQAALMDEGEIKCTATNRAGHSITKARLRLEAPPTIRLPKQYEDGLLFEMGEIIKLKVSVAGMPPPTARWLHNGESITSSGRCEISHTDKYFNLRINDARRSDRGEYQAHAVNSLGEDVASFLVTVTDRPLPPGKAKVVMTLGKSVTLSWSEPEDDGGCKIGNYIVEYFRIGWNMWLKAATCRQLSTTLGDLIEGSEYKFRVKAENPYGVSNPSEESDVIFIPDPKRGLLQPPVKSEAVNDPPEELQMEDWYDEKKIRGRELPQPKVLSNPNIKRKDKVWKGGDDSLSSGSSVFLSDNDLNKHRNTSSLEGTPIVPKRKYKLSKEFHKSGSLVSDFGDNSDTHETKRSMAKDSASRNSYENIRFRKKSLDRDSSQYGTDDSLNKIKKSKSPSPLRQRRGSTKSPNFDKNSSMSPPPRRRKSTSRSPHREKNDTSNSSVNKRKYSNSSLQREKSKSKSPLDSPKIVRNDVKEKILETDRQISKIPMETSRNLKQTQKLISAANINAESSEYSEGLSSEIDEDVGVTVKNVIQIKIKADNGHQNDTNSEKHFTENPNNLGFQNLSETERQKFSLGTQKSFEDKAEKDLNDMLHGSSELMLLLLPNSSRENTEERELKEKETKLNLSMETIIAPPISLSAPELDDGSFYIDEPYDIPIREAFSSTELLHEKKMFRLYQSLEEIENENEEYKKKMAKIGSTQKLSRKKSLSDRRQILLEKRRSFSEAEESDSSRKFDSRGKFKERSKYSEDEDTTDFSDANNLLDDSSRIAKTKLGDERKGRNEIEPLLESHDENDYDDVEHNEQIINTKQGSDYESDYYPEKTVDESLYGYDSDEFSREYSIPDEEQKDLNKNDHKFKSNVVKDDAYYENLGDILTKKYALNEIQIKIDKPDDEPDYVTKGKYEVDNEMLLKRSKLKPQYSSEMSEASNITDDELDDEDEESYDFDEIFEENPEEEDDQPMNFSRNRCQYMEDEEEQMYHPKLMIKPCNEEDSNDEPPPVPEHQESPDIPVRTTSMLNRLSPNAMLKKQPVKPILKNKSKKVSKVLEVDIHIDNNEKAFDSIVIKSPKVTRKKKLEDLSQENTKKINSDEEILKPILKKENMHTEKINENYKFGYLITSGGNILHVPKLLQKVSDIETSDTDTEKIRRKHVRITEPNGNPDDNDHKIATINHYSDIVKQYGTKQNSPQTKIILNYDELKAKAIQVENTQSINWDTLLEGSENISLHNTNEIKIGHQNEMNPSQVLISQANDLSNRLYENKQISNTRTYQEKNEHSSSQTGEIKTEDNTNREIVDSVSKSISSNKNRDGAMSCADNTTQSLDIIKQKRIHSKFDYTTDVFVFGIACWIYFFKHPILCVPILLLLVCKQLYENRECFLFWKKYYKQYEQAPPE